MNEFTAKKLGEVLAFSRVGLDTYDKGKNAIIEAIGIEKFEDILEKNRIHGEAIRHYAEIAGVLETTLSKAEKTTTKLTEMRNLYVGEEWQNATELMEWSGFFEGAAIVHWQLVLGASETLENGDLSTLAQECVNWHHEMLEMSEGELFSTGQSKATE